MTEQSQEPDEAAELPTPTRRQEAETAYARSSTRSVEPLLRKTSGIDRSGFQVARKGRSIEPTSKWWRRSYVAPSLPRVRYS